MVHYTPVPTGSPLSSPSPQHGPWLGPTPLVRIRSLFLSIGASQKSFLSPLPRNMMPTNRPSPPHHMNNNHHQALPSTQTAPSSPTLKVIPISSEHAPHAMHFARILPLVHYPRSLQTAVHRSTSLHRLALQPAASKISWFTLPNPERGGASASIRLWSNASLSRTLNRDVPQRDS